MRPRTLDRVLLAPPIDEVNRIVADMEAKVCDFFLFRSAEIAAYLTSVGFEIEEIIEREPYPMSSTRGEEVTFSPDGRTQVHEDTA